MWSQQCLVNINTANRKYLRHTWGCVEGSLGCLAVESWQDQTAALLARPGVGPRGLSAETDTHVHCCLRFTFNKLIDWFKV